MLNTINKYYGDVFEIYKEIVSVSSESHDKDGIDRVCEKISAFGKEYGFDVELFENEKAGNELVLSYNGGNEGPLTVFLAHMDTVHKKGAFENMITEKGGKIYGPGVLDCKGGIAISLLTCITLKKYGYQAPLRIVLVCDEEISMILSGKKGIEFIKNNVKDANYVFTCESGTRNKIVVGRKGVARYKITVHGKSSHAGSAYNSGISAVKEACCKIIELERHSNTGGITFNCGMIMGGKAPNIVPDICEFVVDVRYTNKEECKTSQKILDEIIEKSFFEGTKTDVEIISIRSPMEATKYNRKLFKRVKEIADKLGYEHFDSYISGGASDAAFSSEMNIPTLCGMGITGKYQHTPEEEADIISIKERSNILCETVYSLFKERLN